MHGLTPPALGTVWLIAGTRVTIVRVTSTHVTYRYASGTEATVTRKEWADKEATPVEDE